jgi:hypothetical protein
MKLRILAEAEDEVQEAAQWYEGRLSNLGLEFLDALTHALDAIEQQPGRFARLESVRTKREVRRCFLQRFPFKIIYEVRGDEAIVVPWRTFDSDRITGRSALAESPRLPP